MHGPRVATIVTVVLIAASALGCTTHQCDATSTTLDGEDGGGAGSWDLSCTAGCTLTWRSGPLVGPPDAGWIDFPGQKTYKFVFPSPPALPPGASVDFTNFWLPPLAWVAFTPPTAFDSGTNFAQSAGVDVEFTGISSTSLSVFNPSCQDYALLVTFGVAVNLDAGGIDLDAGSVDMGGADGVDGTIGVSATPSDAGVE